MPTLFYWKKGLILIGTTLAILILTYLTVLTISAVYGFTFTTTASTTIKDDYKKSKTEDSLLQKEHEQQKQLHHHQLVQYWITIIYGILFVAGIIGELIGFVGAIRNHRLLIKLYLVYCVLYYLYLLVDILYVTPNLPPAEYPKLYPQYVVADNSEHSMLNQSSHARLFWALLWDVVVVLFWLDLKHIHSMKTNMKNNNIINNKI